MNDIIVRGVLTRPRATALNDGESLVPFWYQRDIWINSSMEITPMKIFLNSSLLLVPVEGTRARRCHSNNPKILNDTDIDSFSFIYLRYPKVRKSSLMSQ